MRGESVVSQSASWRDVPDDTSTSVDTIHGHTIPPFSPSVRRRRCSQVGQDVRRQNAPVRRYAPRVIRTKRAQQSRRFPGMACDVLAPLQLSLATRQRVGSGRQAMSRCSFETSMPTNCTGRFFIERALLSVWPSLAHASSELGQLFGLIQEEA